MRKLTNLSLNKRLAILGGFGTILLLGGLLYANVAGGVLAMILGGCALSTAAFIYINSESNRWLYELYSFVPGVPFLAADQLRGQLDSLITANHTSPVRFVITSLSTDQISQYLTTLKTARVGLMMVNFGNQPPPEYLTWEQIEALLREYHTLYESRFTVSWNEPVVTITVRK